MPISSVEPQDPLKVWECKALQKHGSAEVQLLTPLPLLHLAELSKRSVPVTGADIASADRQAGAACHA